MSAYCSLVTGVLACVNDSPVSVSAFYTAIVRADEEILVHFFHVCV